MFFPTDYQDSINGTNKRECAKFLWTIFLTEERPRHSTGGRSVRPAVARVKGLLPLLIGVSHLFDLLVNDMNLNFAFLVLFQLFNLYTSCFGVNSADTG